MNKEQQQIMMEAYRQYSEMSARKLSKSKTYQEFINKCKTDSEFSKNWGLKIEERELTPKERIILAGYDYENKGGIGWNMLKETVDMDNSIPRKLITLTYNNETIESYE